MSGLRSQAFHQEDFEAAHSVDAIDFFKPSGWIPNHGGTHALSFIRKMRKSHFWTFSISWHEDFSKILKSRICIKALHQKGSFGSYSQFWSQFTFRKSPCSRRLREGWHHHPRAPPKSEAFLSKLTSESEYPDVVVMCRRPVGILFRKLLKSVEAGQRSLVIRQFDSESFARQLTLSNRHTGLVETSEFLLLVDFPSLNSAILRSKSSNILFYNQDFPIRFESFA